MKIIITGGAGFIGANAAMRALKAGNHVIVMDNLARDGSRKNLAWLEAEAAPLEFINLDLRSASEVSAAFRAHRDADRVLHLAAQVAVTKSVDDPRADFDVNAGGSLNVLEAMRAAGMNAPVIFSSTNKVYGSMNHLPVAERDGRYAYARRSHGVPETQNLDFHSPYGCSKGAADQYFLDYHRIYGLRTIVFRQSCIYGYRQFGMEDQGWVAWFLIASQLGRPVTIYGDGKQVRDILFIDDLLDAYDAAFAAGESALGRAYNIGGGPGNVLSLLELIRYIENRQKKRLPLTFAEWRPGDQRVFVSDIRRAARELAWRPRIRVRQGLDLLYEWVSANLHLFDNPRIANASSVHAAE